MSWETALGIADIAMNLFNTGYNIHTNKRDFDYQKALQQTMFEREDNAVQRRMQDLIAAGINPNIAAGSSANSGPVVSRSNTNDLNIGSTLDTLSAMQQIRNQKQQTENLKKEGQILSIKKSQEEWNQTLNEMLTLKSLGYNVKPNTNNGFGYIYEGDNKFNEKPNDYGTNYLFNQLQYQNDSLKNSADLLQRENDWYTANQITNMIGSLGSVFIPKVNFGFSKRR